MFYDNFVKQCNKIEKAPSAAAIEMGFHRSEVTRWSKGVMPRRANLQRMATYFNCTIDDLLADEKTAAPEGDGEQAEWVKAWAEASPEQRALALSVLRLGSQPHED